MTLAFGVLHRRWLDLRTWALAAGLAAAAVVPWAIRSVLLSGCLVYPVAATCFPSLPWSVPLPRVREEAVWIGSWARTETVDPPVGTRWLVPWAYRMGRSTV